MTFSTLTSIAADSYVEAAGATVDFSSQTVSGAGAIKLASGTIRNLTVGSGMTLSVTGNGTLSNIAFNKGSIFNLDAGCSLELSGAITLASAIQNSGTVTVSAGTVFNLTGSLKTAEGVYTLIDGGTINGWDLLENSNFTYYGVAIDTMRSASVGVSTAGAVTLSVADLTWAGPAEGSTWDVKTTQNWTNASTSASDVFYTGDNVTFSGNATVTVADGGVAAGSVTIASGATVTLSGGNVAAAGFTLESGATLSLGAGSANGATATLAGNSRYIVSATTGAFDFSNVSGTGSLVFRPTVSNPGYNGGIKVSLSENFTGNFVLDSNVWLSFAADHSTFGNATIVLSGDALFHSTKTVNLANNIRFDGSAAIWTDNANATVTLSGDVTGSSGTLNRRGAGAMIFSKSVSVGTFNQENGVTTVTGTANVNTLAVSGGTLNISGTATISEKLSASKNGTVNIGKDDGSAMTVTAEKFFTNDSNADGTNTVNIKAGATLNITGTANAADSRQSSILIGHWEGTSKVNVAGTLSAANAVVNVSWTSGKTATLTVKYGGKVSALGIGQAQSGSGTANFVMEDGGTLELGASGITKDMTQFKLGAGTFRLTDNWSAATTQDMTLSSSAGTTFDTNGFSATLSGVISDATDATGALKKTGTGTLTLSGHNTYSGGTTIEGGVLKVDSLGYGDKGNLGTKFTQDGTVLKDGGVLEVTAAQNATAEGNTYGNGGALRGFSVASGEGTYRYTGAETSYIAPNLNGGALQRNSHIGIADGATLIFDVTRDTATLEVSKIIASNAAQATTSDPLAETTGALKKTGAGTLTLSGANLYSGGTTIEQGVLVAGSETALGTTKGVEVKSGATLNLGTSAVTVAGLSGAGTVGLAEGTTSSTLTVNGGGVFSGMLSGGENSLALVFDAYGQTLELNPELGNSLSSVEITAGTVKTGNAFGLGYSADVSVQSAGALALEFTASKKNDYGLMLGGITFAAGSSFVVDVTGAAENDVLKIITSSVIRYNNGTQDVSLTSDNLDSFVNDFVTLNGWDGLADWSYADSVLSVTLTIPEPSVFGLLAGLGALALAGTRRRRRKA